MPIVFRLADVIPISGYHLTFRCFVAWVVSYIFVNFEYSVELGRLIVYFGVWEV